MKKRYKFLIVLIVLMIILMSVRFINASSSEYTTYIPFTGRVFNISEDEVDLIRVQSGSSGEFVDFSTEQEIHDLVELLNGFRYKYWIPDYPFATGGWSYRIILHLGDNKVSYFFQSSWIEVNGIKYYGSEDFYRELTKLFK